MKRSLKDIAELVDGRVVGADVDLRGIASIQTAVEGDLVFVEHERNLAAALASQASAVIAGEFAANLRFAKPLLICKQPRLAFARAGELCQAASLVRPEVHHSAVVHPSAQIGQGVTVAERVVIGRSATVGNDTTIGAGSVIGENVTIGRSCRFYSNVSIYPGTRIGDRVIVHAGAVLGSDGFGYVREEQTGRYVKFPQIGRLEIDDDVEIGANSTVDRGALETTRIGRGTKIDNLVHIGHNCQIGEDVIIAAQTGLSGSIIVEDNVVMGGQVGIGEHAHIGDGVMLGGQSGVLPKKILRGKGVAFWGTPARNVREYLKQLAALIRLAKSDR